MKQWVRKAMQDAQKRHEGLSHSGVTDIEAFPLYSYELAFKSAQSMRRTPPPPCLVLPAKQWPYINRAVVRVSTLRPLPLMTDWGACDTSKGLAVRVTGSYEGYDSRPALRDVVTESRQTAVHASQ